MDATLFQQQLLQWYDQSKRILPWRDNPNPYHVWVSEIMLQQTRVETVIPYFQRFIEVLPTVQDLAEADQDVLHKLWEGLGYYSRVRNLQQAALEIVNRFNGQVPSSYDDLITLKGIGPYTAGAVSSIAFNQPFTAVDGNVLRVFARLVLETKNIKEPAIKKRIKQEVEAVLPSSRIGDFNQALMEIGATVCLPNGQPLCEICPLQSFCQAYRQDKTTEIPLKQGKKTRRKEERTVLVIEYNHRYAIEQRPDKGLLAGLYQFPNVEGFLAQGDIETMFPTALSIKTIKAAKHIFSHIEWFMKGYHITLKEPQYDYTFSTVEEIELFYTIPTAFKAYKTYIKEVDHE